MIFVVGVGWRCGPGASGGSLGVGFMGGSALGLRPWPGWGIGDSWEKEKSVVVHASNRFHKRHFLTCLFECRQL